jgi:hypothetical protein
MDRILENLLLANIKGSYMIKKIKKNNGLLWRIVFSRLNIFIISLCLASYGVSEAVYPCNVVEKIHEYFRSKMRQYLERIKLVVV